MKSSIIGTFVLLALIAAAKSDQTCVIDGNEVVIPDTIQCESYVNEVTESSRFPSIPWWRIPPILSTLFPNWTRRTTTPMPLFKEECPDEGIKSIAHPNHCDKYILCIGGQELERRCAAGFQFSRRFRTCVTPDIADCTESDSKSECPDEDDLDNLVFLPNTENCGKYYLCFGGDQIPMTCSDGLHWSVENNMCLAKKNANCKFEDDNDIEECPETGVKSISHPDNCEKYVLCVGGTRVKRDCAPGLHFSRKTRTCVDAEIAGCEVKDEDDNIEQCPDSGVKSISHPDNCEKYVLCVGGTRVKRDCAPGLHFSRKTRTCVDAEIAGCEVKDEDDDIEQCPDSGVKSISHPDNCEKYVLCVGGTRVKRDCAPGLHFSRKTRTCVDAEIAGCEVKDEDDDIEQCPDSGIKSISHPDNCEKYVLCVGGTRVKRDCAPGLHFSRKTRTCVDAEIAGCEEIEPKLKCPKVDDPNRIIFLPNSENCSKYFFCFQGEAMPLSCPDGLHWSTTSQMCMNKDEAGCMEVEEDDDIEQCPDSGIKSISHPDNCEKYVLCVGGTRVKRDCAPGLHFSRSLQNCVQPDLAKCEETTLTCPKKDELDNLVFLPNKEDCSMYYVCFGGEPVPLSCSGGLHWSVKEQRCMHSDKANCDFEHDNDIETCPESGIKQISHPSSCEKYILCVGGSRIKRDCAPGFHFSRSFRTCVQPDLAECQDSEQDEEKAFSCPEKDDMDELIFRPSEEDCARYYLCFGGEKVSFTCSDGLHWSTKQEMCMTPDDANCKLTS